MSRIDFDASSVAVPFRMQPGLRRLGPDARLLTPLERGSRLWQEKHEVVAADASRLRVPGFDDGVALEAIRRRAALEGQIAGDPLELVFEEDFALLDGRDATLPWLSVCVPSHWAPEDKLGLPFHAVHAPVADAGMVLAAAQSLVALATSGALLERQVWTVTPDPHYDQHPRRRQRRPGPATSDPAEFVASCWLRAERQCFFPLGDGTPRAIFTIRVMLQPLAEAADTPARARRLGESLASMSEAVLAYKNLAPARDRLLAWLRSRAGAQPEPA